MRRYLQNIYNRRWRSNLNFNSQTPRTKRSQLKNEQGTQPLKTFAAKSLEIPLKIRILEPCLESYLYRCATRTDLNGVHLREQFKPRAPGNATDNNEL